MARIEGLEKQLLEERHARDACEEELRESKQQITMLESAVAADAVAHEDVDRVDEVEAGKATSSPLRQRLWTGHVELSRGRGGINRLDMSLGGSESEELEDDDDDTVTGSLGDADGEPEQSSCAIEST